MERKGKLVTQSYLTLWDPMDCSLPGPLSMGFSRQEYWSGLPHSLLQGIFLTQRSNPGLLHCRQILSRLSHQGSPTRHETCPNSVHCLARETLRISAGSQLCGIQTAVEKKQTPKEEDWAFHRAHPPAAPHTPRSEGWARVPSYRAREAGPAEQKRRVDTVSLCCSRIKREAGEQWELRMKTWTGFGSWGLFRSCEELELCPRCPLGAASAPRHLPAPWHQGLRLTPQPPSRYISPWGGRACNTHWVQRMDLRGLTRGWTDCPITVDFPSSPVVKNLPANAGDTGLIPGPGRFHVL